MRGSTPRTLSPRRRARVGWAVENRLVVVGLRCTVLGRMVGGKTPGSRLAGEDSRNDLVNLAEILIRPESDGVASARGADLAVRCSILVQAVVAAAGRSL